MELDPSTGKIDLTRIVAVEDCGTMINPQVVEGQMRGGIAQGIGMALLESLEYDANGQLNNAQATSFVQALRREKLNKVPGLSEAIDWAKALKTTGVRVLERSNVERTIGCLLKDRQDIASFKQGMVAPLLEKIGSGHGLPAVDSSVRNRRPR
jgi:hypothetical protein